MSGTKPRPRSNSMGCAIQERSDFSVQQQPGANGQEILDSAGKVVCWTMDSELAHRIVKLLNA
jgi:hypothetical protein